MSSVHEPGVFETRCMSDFVVAGFQAGEKETSFVRMLCTFTTASIVSSWIARRDAGRRLRLFFAHWLSGLVHQLAQLALSNLVLLCWTRHEILWILKVLKFIEMGGANMLAITNVAICASLAQVVASHRTLSRVKSTVTPGLIWAFWALAVLAVVPSVPFWDDMAVLGTVYWPYSDSPRANRWVLISVFYMEILAASIMIVIVALLVVFRRPELRQVWRLHRRIRYYMGLTLIAIIVDLGMGVGGMLYILTEYPLYTIVTWTARHVHIALDTLVLYSALGVTHSPKANGRHVAEGTVKSGGGGGSGEGSGSMRSKSSGGGCCGHKQPGAGSDAKVGEAVDSPRRTGRGRGGVDNLGGNGDGKAHIREAVKLGAHRRGGSRGSSGGYHVTKPAVELVDAVEDWHDESERYSYRRYKSSDMPCASV